MDKVFYYNARHFFPLFVYAFYFQYGDKDWVNILNGESYIIKYLIILEIILFTIFGLFKFPMKTVIGFEWSYYAVFEWLLFMLFSYELSMIKTGNILFSINYVTQASIAGGYLYEIPYFLNIGETGLFTDRIFNTQIFSIIALYFLLRHKKIQVNKLIILGVALYFITLNLFILNYDYFKIREIQRIPTIIMLYTFLTGIPSKSAKEGSMDP